MFRLLTILIASTVVASAHDIEARAFWAAGSMPSGYDEPLLHRHQMDVFLQIRNIGASEAAVLCPKKRLVFDATPSLSVMELAYVVRLQHGVAGVRYVPPLDELSPVKLMPGEVTEVRLSAELPKGAIPNKVMLRYCVEEQIARRFEGWFGEIVTPLRLQRSGQQGAIIPWSRKEPNKAPEPTPTSVTSPAAQEPRQP